MSDAGFFDGRSGPAAVGRQAWPFLIGRSRHAGYRVLVVPQFLASPRGVSALASAARTIDLPEGAAAVRELRGLPGGPLCIVYRSDLASADDYALQNAGILTDEHGRGIRLAEGFAVRLSAAQVSGLSVTREDLDRTHAAVAETFREFWDVQDAFARRASEPFALGGQGTGHGTETRQPLRLELIDPWGTPMREIPQLPEGQVPQVRHVRQGAEDVGPHRGAMPTRGTAVALLVAALAVIAVGVSYLALNRWPSPAASPPSSVSGSPALSQGTVMLRKFCKAIHENSASRAYAYMSPVYQQQTSLQSFGAAYFPDQSSAGRTCTVAVTKSTDTAVTADLTIGVGSKPAGTVWRAVTSGSPGGTWHIDSLGVGS